MPAADRATILIVEDDPGVARLQARCLERAGYRVLTTPAPAAAMEHVQQNSVDLIVVDLRLPGGMTGLDLHEQLKAAGHDIPAIVVTGFSDEATAIRSLRAGIRDVVSKSVEYLDYLPHTVGRVLEQVRLEGAVREQAALLEKARDAIMVRDMQDRIVYWNPRAEELYGWPAAEALGRRADELLYREVPPEFAQAQAAVLEHGEWTGQLRQVSREGRPILVESRWTLVRDPAGRPRSKLIINTDITEKQQLQDQLLHAQRLESVGALAGGVAHEFNNLLQAIGGYTQFALDALPAEHPAIADLREIARATERAVALTRSLLGFGRRQILRRVDLDANQVIGGLLTMIRPLLGARIELRTELGDDGGIVSADSGLLEQVLMNLCVNARDAMPHGGRLTIRTGQVLLDCEHCRQHPEARPGRHLLLTVADTGCGMTREVRERIFEPFFTTKPVGKGTGLGLSMVYGVVRQHEGTIHVESEPGVGTTFRILLPLVGFASSGQTGPLQAWSDSAAQT